jgi:site-specific DNA-methyltransferase (adenine-specific)
MSRVKKHYSLFGDLTPPEYEALKASIREHGVHVPVLTDEQGSIVDGVHRDRACEELGIPCPRLVRTFKSEAEKWEVALAANVRRRQLTRQQKRDLVAVYLKADPEINDNWLAELIGGISKNTVGRVRAHLVATRQVDEFTTLRGRDGKKRPTKYARVIVNTAKDMETARKALRVLETHRRDEIISAATARRRAGRQAGKRLKGKVIVPSPDDCIRLYHCALQDIERVGSVPPDSVHLLLTDVPYGHEFLPQMEDLAKLAQRILIPGGLFVSYYGHHYFFEAADMLRKHLTPFWLGNSTWAQSGNVLFPMNVTSKWKPVFLFSKGKPRQLGRWCDVFNSNKKEKGDHEWQQPLAEVELMARYFSKPGELLCDPCGGAFTTALAARNLGRRFVGCDIEASCVLTGLARLKRTTPPKSTQAG